MPQSILPKPIENIVFQYLQQINLFQVHQELYRKWCIWCGWITKEYDNEFECYICYDCIDDSRYDCNIYLESD